MSEDPVLREDRDGVRLLTLNRPEKKNAFHDPQWDALQRALREARHDPAVAVVVVTGAGDDFSAGQDLTAFGGGGAPRPDAEASGYFGFMDALCEFDKPLLAAARGVGIGIGATLLFHCDVVYVGESVRLRLPFVSLGLVPEAASSYLLQAAIGSQRAAELFYTAEWIDAERAVALGLAARAFPDAELLDATLDRASTIARFPVGALQATKRCLMVPHRAAIRAARDAEDAGMRAQAGSPENVEAIQAFLQKREPDFKKLRNG
ncbi:MAG: enoyl-CoA hydratase-related protein [Proteobacteria bacterium]|nr:enoyl-CoA hydratase-related protein [Pseudomonadota bacterium]